MNSAIEAMKDLLRAMSDLARHQATSNPGGQFALDDARNLIYSIQRKCRFATHHLDVLSNIDWLASFGICICAGISRLLLGDRRFGCGYFVLRAKGVPRRCHSQDDYNTDHQGGFAISFCHDHPPRIKHGFQGVFGIMAILFRPKKAVAIDSSPSRIQSLR